MSGGPYRSSNSSIRRSLAVKGLHEPHDARPGAEAPPGECLLERLPARQAREDAVDLRAPRRARARGAEEQARLVLRTERGEERPRKRSCAARPRRREGRVELSVERGGPGVEGASGAGEPLRGARRRFLEGGEDAPADPVPRAPLVRVRLVLAVRKLTERQEPAKLPARERQERPDHAVRAPRTDAAAGASGAPLQVEEDGLRLVVAGVPRRDESPRAPLPGRFEERRVTRCARASLEAA